MCLKDAFSPVKKNSTFMPWSLKLPKGAYWAQGSKQGQKIQFYTMEILSVSWIFSDLGSNHSQVTTEKKSIVISVLEFIGSVRI